MRLRALGSHFRTTAELHELTFTLLSAPPLPPMRATARHTATYRQPMIVIF